MFSKLLKEWAQKDQVAPQMAAIQIPNATVILAPMDTAFFLKAWHEKWPWIWSFLIPSYVQEKARQLTA